VQLTIDDFELNHNTKLISPNMKMEKRAPRKALKYNVKAFVQLKTQDCKTFAQDKQSSRMQEDSMKLLYLKDSVKSDTLYEPLPRL